MVVNWPNVKVVSFSSPHSLFSQNSLFILSLYCNSIIKLILTHDHPGTKSHSILFPQNYLYYHIKKAKVDDADRLADELRDEQELSLEFEKDCKLLESQVKEMEQRLDEAKANGFRNHNKFARVNT